MGKSELRKIIRNRKRQYSSSQLEELSLSVISRLSTNLHLLQAHTVLMYYSLPDEVNTHQYIDQLVRQGKEVLLPKVVDDEHMVLRKYTGATDLKKGAFNIMEPIGTVFPEEQYAKIEVGIIPGMSFDALCNRLGRGKGYYDRFLEKVPNMYKIGICFDFQKEGIIPTQESDIKMDEVI